VVIHVLSTLEQKRLSF